MKWDDIPDTSLKWDDIPEAAQEPQDDGFIDSMKQRVSGFFSPENWKQAASDLANFPKYEDAPKDEFGFPAGFEQIAKDTAVIAGPVTPGSGMEKLLAPKPSAADIVKQKTLESAGKAGYSVPRSNIKQTILTNLGERFGGKQAIEATAQFKNQPITNKLAAKALGLADDAPITPEVLNNIRETAGKAYERAKSIGTLNADKAYMDSLKTIETKFAGASKDFPELASNASKQLADALKKPKMTAEGVVEQIKYLRDAAKSNLMQTSGPEAKLLGKAQRAAADALDDLLGRHVSAKLGKQAHKDYLSARQQIAKTYTVEKALNPATGNVVGREIAKQGKKVPLTDELKQISEFSQAFPRLSREPIGAPASGGLFEPLVYGGVGSAMTGDLFGAGAALIPIVAKPVSRHLMTTVPKATKARPPGNAFIPRATAGIYADRDNKNSLRR